MPFEGGVEGIEDGLAVIDGDDPGPRRYSTFLFEKCDVV